MIPFEVLLAIFSVLQPARYRTEDVWTVHSTEAQRRGLISALLVCRSWHAPAAEVFYTVVRPRTADALVGLADTLASNPLYATSVLVVDFPDETEVLTYPLNSLRVRVTLQVSRKRARLGRAVDTILRVCTKAEDFVMHSLTSDMIGAHGLREVSSRIVYLCLARPSTWWHLTAGENQGSKWPSRYRFLQEQPSSSWGSPLWFPQLEVLRITRCVVADDLSFLAPPGSPLQTVFPRIRALFLSAVEIRRIVLMELFAALDQTLEILSLSASSLHYRGRASSFDYNRIAPHGLPSRLRDLRVLRAIDLNIRPPPCPFHNMHKHTVLTDLSVCANIAAFVDLPVLPPSLRRITMYYLRPTIGWDVPLNDHEGEWLNLLSGIKRRLPRWKENTTGLELVRQRAGKIHLHYLPYWQMHCTLLGYFCEQSHVDLQTELWCVLELGEAFVRVEQLLGWTSTPPGQSP